MRTQLLLQMVSVRAARVASRESNRRDGGGDKREKEQSEWEEKIIQVRRVTKVVKGGKKLSFRAVVAVGNGKGSSGHRRRKGFRSCIRYPKRCR